MLQMTRKVLITPGYDEDFPEQVEKQLGYETIILERDYMEEYQQQNVEKAYQDCGKDGLVLVSFSGKGDSNYTTIFNALVKLYDDEHIIPIKFTQDASVSEILNKFGVLDYKHEHFWKDLQGRVNNRRPLREWLPAGNIAQGLVWNYFYGYLMRIMQEYPQLYMDTVVNDDRHHGVKGLKKLIILLPKTCACKDLLDEYDSNISYMKDDEIEKRKNRAGQEKIMLNAVYKIKHGLDTYVLLLEVPNIITTISKLKGRTDLCRPFTDDDIDKQYVEFRNFLMEALEYQTELRDLYLVVEFDERDRDGKLGELIVSKVLEDVAKPKPMEIDAEYIYDVNIVGEESNVKDTITKLENDGFKVFLPSQRLPGSSEIQEMTSEITSSRKTLLFIDSQLTPEQSYVSNQTKYIQAEKKKGKLLPVIKAGTPLDIANKFDFLRNCNHLVIDEPDFYEKLTNAIKDDVPLTYLLGDIATGLVYAYIINYLEQNLQGYVNEYNKLLAYDKENVLFPIFICLVPASCYAPGKITQYDPSIVRMTDDYKEEIQLNIPVAGKVRKYNIPINKVTSKKRRKTYKVMCEFVTPLAALADMERGMKTQLSNTHKLTQKARFDELFQNLVSVGTANGGLLRHCAVLRFDDDFKDPIERCGPKFDLSEMIADIVEQRLVH